MLDSRDLVGFDLLLMKFVGPNDLFLVSTKNNQIYNPKKNVAMKTTLISEEYCSLAYSHRPQRHEKPGLGGHENYEKK